MSLISNRILDVNTIQIGHFIDVSVYSRLPRLVQLCVVIDLILMMRVLPVFSCPVSVRAAVPPGTLLQAAWFAWATLCTPSPYSFSEM